MSHLLDTNACIKFLNQSDAAVTKKIKAARPEDIYLCDVVKGELFYGAYKSSRREANLLLLRRYMECSRVKV